MIRRILTGVNAPQNQFNQKILERKMIGIMIVILIIVAAIVATTWICCKVSGDCSRTEEELCEKEELE